MRTLSGMSASVLPSGSVCTSEPLRCQYSAALCVCMTFGCVLLFCIRREDAVGLLRERIGRCAVGEREHVGGIEMILVLAVVPRRLGEAMVEEAEPAAGDVRDQAVEDDAALLVVVEAW